MTDDPLSGAWDVIVIGAGMGGGLAARRLAEGGLRVLILDRGRMGHRTEATPFDQGVTDPVARHVRGFWPEPVTAAIDGQTRVFHAPIGAGPGGSSVFYAATLERPEPHDLDDLPGRPHPTGGWPVGFAEMRPWFDEAERLLSVHGAPDPLSDEPQPRLSPAPAPNPADTAIMARLSANGMHPYRLHAALRYVEGCAECFGRKCPRPCKMDGRSAGVEPALATGLAHYAGEVEVRRLIGDGGAVDGVEVVAGGQSRVISAPRIVLAAGALGSPRIAMAAGGIGLNGPVGRNLMFHLNEMFAVFPGKSAARSGPSKSVGFRDLYHMDDQRLGMVQAMGVDAGEGEILHILRERAARLPMGQTRLVREATRLPARAAAALLGHAKLFVGLIEDLPLPQNRVLTDPEDPMAIRFDYRVTEELKARRALFRKTIRRVLRGMPILYLNRAPEPNFGHPCGTMAMSAGPETGVVDATGRAHGLRNLWVADASVFPTSMGVNPSLTIAAHALRVADTILKEAK